MAVSTTQIAIGIAIVIVLAVLWYSYGYGRSHEAFAQTIPGQTIKATLLTSTGRRWPATIELSDITISDDTLSGTTSAIVKANPPTETGVTLSYPQPSVSQWIRSYDGPGTVGTVVPISSSTLTDFERSGVDFSALPLSCPSGRFLTINSGDYAGVDNTSVLGKLCNGMSSCMINVLPSSFKMANGQPGSLLPDDPSPGNVKTLKVAYSCKGQPSA